MCKIMPDVLMKPIYKMGRYSILLFAVHFMDGIWYPLVEDNINIYLSIIIRLFVDVSLFFAILFIKRKRQLKIENPKTAA